jgi:hypothetical protein
MVGKKKKYIYIYMNDDIRNIPPNDSMYQTKYIIANLRQDITDLELHTYQEVLTYSSPLVIQIPR